MSVVVCKVKKNSIEIAADSIMTAGWCKIPSQKGTPHIKMQRFKDIIIGGCGLAEENSLIFHYLKTHCIEEVTEKGVLDFMLEFGKWKAHLTGGSATFSNEYILVCKGKAFAIYNMLVIPITDYFAIGAGQDYAYGALYAGASAEQAVKAACDLCAMVSEPIVVEKMEKSKDEE